MNQGAMEHVWKWGQRLTSYLPDTTCFVLFCLLCPFRLKVLYKASKDLHFCLSVYFITLFYVSLLLTIFSIKCSTSGVFFFLVGNVSCYIQLSNEDLFWAVHLFSSRTHALAISIVFCDNDCHVCADVLYETFLVSGYAWLEYFDDFP